MIAHTFNPSIREVETGSDMAGLRGEYEEGGNMNSDFSLRFLRECIHSEVS